MSARRMNATRKPVSAIALNASRILCASTHRGGHRECFRPDASTASPTRLLPSPTAHARSDLATGRSWPTAPRATRQRLWEDEWSVYDSYLKSVTHQRWLPG